MDNISNVLKDLWLNEKEIKIYLTSLSIGQSPSSILWQKHNIPRTTANYICQSLVDKWIMSTVQKWNSYLFSPESPDKLLVILNKEQERLSRKFSSTKQIIWDLKGIMNPYMKLPTVKYFTWVDGIIEILEDVFSEKEVFYGAFNYVKDIHPDLDHYLQNQYLPKRVETKIPSKFLFNDNQSSKEYTKNNSKINRVTLSVKKNLFPFKIGMHIYSNDKIALFSIDRADMTGIIIQNKNIRDSMLSMFKLSWNYAKTLPENKKYINVDI